MHFHHSTKSESNLPGLATDNEKESLFLDKYEDLYWIARFICDDPERAHIAIVDVGNLSDTANPVFRDWLQKWTRAATARAAVEGIRGTILNAALAYSAASGTAESVSNLTNSELHCLHALEVERVAAHLDPFARAVLVMLGVLQHSVSDCARFIGVHRDRVIAAYAHARNWLRVQVSSDRKLESTSLDFEFSESPVAVAEKA